MNISENSIVWSGKEFLLKDFIETFPLPQIIKVEEGYHDQFEEDRTLSASQLLTLHSVKELAIVKALATEKSLEMLLPADSESKVSIINRSDGPEYYDTVEDLASGFPKFATSANNFQCFGISATDVLELKKKVKKHRENYLVCNVVGKNRTVEIPFSFKARFKALGNCPSVSPTLEDVVKCCELPCTVRFMDSKLKLHRNGFEIERPLGFNALGPIKLISLSHYKVVFTTTWEDQNTNVLPLPIDLEVRIVAALGAIQNDKTYSKLCKIAQDKTESEKLVLKFIRHGPCKVLMENIESQPVNDEEGTSYSEIGPKLLPRNYKTQRRPAPTPKPRTKSAPTEVLVNKKPLPSPTKQMQDHDVFNDNESCISVSNSGRTQGFSLNLQNLPPSKDEMEAETNLPNLASGESRNILRASSKKLGQIFSPLKKVPSKVGSEVKKRISKRSSPIPDLSSSSALSSAYSTGSSSSASSSSASSSSASSSSASSSSASSSSASSSSASSSSASSSSASSSGANRAEARSEYREVKRLPGCSADRLNLELLNAINIKTKNNLRDKLNVENPKDVQSWSIRDVAEVLRFCHLEMYIEKFKEEKIDGVLLLSLDDEALTSLGVEDSLHQTKLLKIIGGWLPKM